MQNISPVHRLAWVDFAKGLVMITVIIGHNIVYNNEILARATLVAVYEFHMPFFFVMAGFLLNLDKWGGDHNYKNFSSKLVKRLLIPYYLVEILWYPIWLVAGHLLGHAAYIRNTALTPLDAFFGIFVGNGNMLALVPLWFLPALFLAEIIFVKLHNQFAKVGEDIFALIIVTVSYLGYVIGKIFPLPLSPDIAMTAQVFIFAGVLIRKYNVLEHMTLLRCVIPVLMFATVFLLNGKIRMAARIYGDLPLFYAGGLARTLLVMKFFLTAERLGGKFYTLMEFCGRQSLFVMIMHMPIVFIIYDATIAILNRSLQDVAFLPEVIIAAILLGTLVPLWIAKNFGKKPVLKYLCT